jgi:hypothetical protein
MIDSEDAVWIERETARLANPPDLLATIEAELAAAAESWYGTTDPGQRRLRSAFARVLEAREGGRGQQVATANRPREGYLCAPLCRPHVRRLLNKSFGHRNWDD